MKILFILHSTIMGGATISFLNLVAGLREKDYSIAVVAPELKEEFVCELERLGIQYYRCPIVMSVLWPNYANKSSFKKIRYRLGLLRKKWKSCKELSLIVRKEAPNVIHTNVGVVHEGFLISRYYGIPHVWHLREYQDKDFGWRVFPSKLLLKLMLRKSYVVSITKDVHRHFGLLETNKHKVIYNGVFPEEYASLSLPKERFFLCASRISREKGHEEVIKAFSVFYKCYPEYKLVILGFGDDGYLSSLKEQCSQMGCGDAVCFVGYQRDVKPFMKSAQALIVASQYEGFGRMSAEAAFSGCVLIGRNTGGTKEILDSVGGYAFDTTDELVSNMKKVAEMPIEDYREEALMSQKKAKALYSNEKNVQLMDEFYHSMIG